MVHWMAIASPPIALAVIGFLIWRERMQHREAEERYWSPFTAAESDTPDNYSSFSLEEELLQQMLASVKAQLAHLRGQQPGPARRCC